jgi:hypothetical protein
MGDADRGDRALGERDLVVGRNDPVMIVVRKLGLCPKDLAYYFFCVFSFSLSLFASAVPFKHDVPNYQPYIVNVSWSLSMLFIFPFVVGFILKYYNEVPKLYYALFARIEDAPEEEFEKFIERLDRRFNTKLVPVVVIVGTVLLNLKYYTQILNKEAGLNWISSGDLLEGILNTDSGFTGAGLYSAAIQVVLIYTVFYLAWNCLVFAWGLHLFFNEYKFNIKINPLHSDRCCGLKRIGDVSILSNTVLFFLGIYLSLKVIDKVVLQGVKISNDIGNPAFLCFYVVLAPLLFFLPLASAHRKMKFEKDKLVSSVSRSYSKAIVEIKDNYSKDLMEQANSLDALLVRLDKKIPVWPFNFKSLESFFGAVVAPVLPILLPFVVNGVIDWVKSMI